MDADSVPPEAKPPRDVVRHGRNVFEGYKRGSVACKRDRIHWVLNDPLYKKAHAIGGDRALTFLPKRANIFLILKDYLGALPKGDIVEFGTFRGGLAMMMASVCQELHPDLTVHALDTFEGLPDIDPSIDRLGRGAFSEGVDYDEIVEYAGRHGLTNLNFVRGLFQDTAEGVLREAKRVSLVHIDCDIRSAVEYAYDVVQPYLVDGAYIIFDDANHWGFIGATEVVEDIVIRRDDKRSEQVDPHFVFRHNLR